MTLLLRGVIVLAFAVSSVLKLVDLEPTIQAAASEFHLGQGAARILICGLILFEACLAAGILLARDRTRWYQTAFLFLVLAAVLVGVMAVMGLQNCLCFGEWIVVPPFVTLTKNLMLSAAVAYQALRDRSDKPIAREHLSADCVGVG